MATASLTSNLLARKGHASPSATVQPLYQQVKSTWLQDLLASDKQPAREQTKKGQPRVYKSLHLEEASHQQLRLLAARTGKSQQMLMEKAVMALLEEAKQQNQCICGGQ
ncbi:hypothetical protein [Kordiimonas pumila]|uniref:Ribbon-helix-helix protein CopG domain-containing protein n=1 Tax=Kordiimonas pumila TaxID=2161677 RepID=A0ABV7D548_9PROT|nr:hypothetical protein [Kordiimonas pumila]